MRRVTLRRRATTPSSTTLVGEVPLAAARPLAPLWELCLVDGFEDDRFAIVYKTHHAMADGISAVDIGVLLFDVEPDTEPSASRGALGPAAAALAPAASPAAPSTGISAPRGALVAGSRRAAGDPRRAGRRAADGIAGLWEVTWTLTKPAPKVPLNVDIVPHRELLRATAPTSPSSN